jgi:hypothetical protein
MSGLALRQVGMDPKTVAGEEIGHLGDGQRKAVPLYVDIHFRTGQIKGSTVSKTRRRGPQKNEEHRHQDGEPGKSTVTHGYYCTDAAL